MNKRNTPYIAIGVLVCCLLLLFYLNQGTPRGERSTSVTKSASIGISGVSGVAFSGKPFRTYRAKRLFVNYISETSIKAKVNDQCKYWIVFTSIHNPSDSVLMLSEVTRKESSDWCCVVVLDQKTSMKGYSALETDRFVVLTLEKQQKLSKQRGFSLIDAIPFNHFGRKNIGFLYAVSQGAELIYDTDDDNLLKTNVIPYTESTSDYLLVSSKDHVYNPYKLFNSTIPHSLWPRGIPMDSIMRDKEEIVDIKTTGCRPNKPEDITIFQILADHDPDVDAIYRLTNPLPIYFDPSKEKPLVLQLGTASPLNAQCTVTHYSSIFGLYLPIHLNGRVSDIWRSYYIQGLHKGLGQYVAFTKAHIKQIRNAHDYLADFNSEIPLYTQATEIVKFILKWESSAATLEERMEQLAIDFFERGYYEIEDVFGIQRWISDLISLGYKFPSISTISPDCIF